jgi:UDP-N-acetylmuramoylalanine--D-glutamate ligase
MCWSCRRSSSISPAASPATWRRSPTSRPTTSTATPGSKPTPPPRNAFSRCRRLIAPEDQARWPALAGPHNAQNAAVATAIAQALGVADAAIEAGLASYAGLPHRMKRVDEVRGVAFVNDSKATNPTSAAPALAAFPAIHWIAGGQAKTADLDACLPHLANVRSAWLIGEAGPLFAEILAPHVPVHASGTLDRAVAAAAAAAVPGDTVLLSPACASFDQFTDYEARGRAFEDLVRELPR